MKPKKATTVASGAREAKAIEGGITEQRDGMFKIHRLVRRIQAF